MKSSKTNHPKASLERIRENLSTAILNVQRSGVAGTTHVLQLPSGAVYTDRRETWTFNLANARGFNAEATPILGADVVPVSIARKVLQEVLAEHLAQIESLLGITTGKPNG